MDIINNYDRELKIFNGHVIVRLIHKNKDICFNSMNREILYSISDCLINKDNKIDVIYKESYLGKALIVNINEIPSNPPFNELIIYYKKNFFIRLSLIEHHCTNKNFNDLNKIKNKMKSDNYYYFDINHPLKICFKINLPFSIIKHIISYVYFNIKPFYNLRNKYNTLRFST